MNWEMEVAASITCGCMVSSSCSCETQTHPRHLDEQSLKARDCVTDCSRTLSLDNAVTGRLLHSGVSSTLFGSLNYVLAPVLVEDFSCSCELASSTL